MDISLTWNDLVTLAISGKVEKDGNTLSVSRPILPDLEICADRLRGCVRFRVDESDPLSLPPQEAKLPDGVAYIDRSIPRPKRD